MSVTADIETCPYTIKRPGICCICDQRPAAYAVLQEMEGQPLREHLNCHKCAARNRRDPLYVAFKTYLARGAVLRAALSEPPAPKEQQP